MNNKATCNQINEYPFQVISAPTVNRNNNYNIVDTVDSNSINQTTFQTQTGNKMTKVSKVLSALFCDSPQNLRHRCKMITSKKTIQNGKTTTPTLPLNEPIPRSSFEVTASLGHHDITFSDNHTNGLTYNEEEDFPEQPKILIHHESLDLNSNEQRQQHGRKEKLQEDTAINILSWIQSEAPQDLMPKIFSFLGPRTIKALSCLNSTWNHLCLSESIWQTLCEDYHKINHEDQQSLQNHQLTQDNPSFWRQYYMDNPIVPIDFETVESAFDSICCHIYNRAMVTRNRDSQYEVADPIPVQVRKVRILLLPGTYTLKHSLVIYAITRCSVTLETLQNKRHTSMPNRMRSDESNLSNSSKHHKSRFGDKAPCLHNAETSNVYHTENDNDTGTNQHYVHQQQQPTKHTILSQQHSSIAKIVYQTSDMNDPIIYVRQGTLHLRNVALVHDSPGTDIWNGNSAVQIQPPLDHNDFPVHTSFPYNRPRAVLEGVDIKSTSGRGVAVIDGGVAEIEKCNIHNCAATGVYIGGRGSEASIYESDIIRNGFGNNSSRRGIGRGHSGVYLEQGVCTLKECNVSHNSYTGISAESPHNVNLILENSDVVSNGSIELELPPIGSISRNQIEIKNNNFDSRNVTTSSRSGLASMH